MSVPVVLVHGWGGSYASTWQQSGWVDLLTDEGRQIIGVDMLGHGTAPKPHDTAEYVDMSARIFDAIDGHDQVDAIGFSMGGRTLLGMACAAPERFRRLVIIGYGQAAFRTARRSPVVDALDAVIAGEPVDTDDKTIAQFLSYARQPDNDIRALRACMAAERPAITVEGLAAITCPTLIIIGDEDFTGPAEPLADAIPGARSVTVRRLDHFRATEEFSVIDAALKFVSS
jgi:pimeloyl-ACP methyl ester carboxylesterase